MLARISDYQASHPGSGERSILELDKWDSDRPVPVCGDMLKEIIETSILPRAHRSGDRWLSHWGYWNLGQRGQAIRYLTLPLEQIGLEPEDSGQRIRGVLSGSADWVALYYELRKRYFADAIKTPLVAQHATAGWLTKIEEWDMVRHRSQRLWAMGKHDRPFRSMSSTLRNLSLVRLLGSLSCYHPGLEVYRSYLSVRYRGDAESNEGRSKWHRSLRKNASTRWPREPRRQRHIIKREVRTRSACSGTSSQNQALTLQGERCCRRFQAVARSIRFRHVIVLLSETFLIVTRGLYGMTCKTSASRLRGETVGSLEFERWDGIKGIDVLNVLVRHYR